jgi:TPP-dependent pyruvate/acetoin dehydrogenase alpha subunit
MDVLAVESAVSEAAAAVRRDGLPRFIEFRTYRFRAHSMADPDLYRSKAEVEEWKHRCPIETFATMLRSEGLLSDADRKAMEAEVAAEIAEAIAVADAGPWEPTEDLTRDVYTPRETRASP